MNYFRAATVWTLLIALCMSPLAGTARAAESAQAQPATEPAPALMSLGSNTASILVGEPAADPKWQSWSATASSTMAQRGRYRGGRARGRAGRRANGAAEALIFGTAAAITGAAILAYANRPDCDVDRLASGCGYGTKVVGTSVVAGGAVGVLVGISLWR